MLFDKIWCLSCCDKDRLEQSKKEFKKVGLNVEYHFNPKNPVTRWCPKVFVETDYYNEVAQDRGYSNVYEAVISCFVGHYNIIKASYELGYDRILIIEDDIQFVEGINLEEIFAQIPEDADIVHFYDPRRPPKTYAGEDDFFIFKEDHNDIVGNVMVSLNRPAMEAYLNIFEQNSNTPIVADTYYRYLPDNIKVYVNQYNIIQVKEHTSLIEQKDNLN